MPLAKNYTFFASSCCGMALIIVYHSTDNEMPDCLKRHLIFLWLLCNLINIVMFIAPVVQQSTSIYTQAFTCAREKGEERRQQRVKSIFWNHLPFIVQITNKAIQCDVERERTNRVRENLRGNFGWKF
jgi:hypothetical protein